MAMAQKQGGLIIMNQKESLQYEIINNLINQKINGTEASIQINLSIRQTKRLKAMVKKYGLRGIIHGGRNRESNRKIKAKTVEKIKKHIKEEYYDFGPTFAREKLKENHKIEIGTETLRQIMIKEGLWKPRPRRKSGRHKSWRARK